MIISARHRGQKSIKMTNVQPSTCIKQANQHTQLACKRKHRDHRANSQSTYTSTRTHTDHGASQPVNIHKHTHANGSYGKLVSRTQARARTRTIEHVIRLHVQHLQIAAAQHHILHDEEPQSRGHPQLALRVRLEDVGCHCSERSSPERTKPRSVSKNR